MRQGGKGRRIRAGLSENSAGGQKEGSQKTGGKDGMIHALKWGKQEVGKDTEEKPGWF